MKAKPSKAQTTQLPVSSVAGGELTTGNEEMNNLVAKAPAKLTANWFSTVFVTWINPLLKLGSRRPLDILDLCAVPDCMVADPLTAKLSTAYVKQVEEKGQAVKDSSTATASATSTATVPSYLLNAMISVFGVSFVLGGAFLLSELIYLTPILVLTDFVKFMEAGPAAQVPFPYSLVCDAKNFVWFGPALMFCLQVFSTILLNTYFLAIRYLGIRVRTAISGLIYRKSLRLSCAARQVSSCFQVHHAFRLTVCLSSPSVFFACIF